MSATSKTGQSELAVRLPRASVFGFLVGAVLFLVSAVPPHLASLQRWVVLRGQRPGSELTVEDHQLDYTFPSDPWEPIGNAAQLFGTGMIVQGVGVLAMDAGVLGVPRVAPNRIGVIAKTLLALVVATSFAATGIHALVSGGHGVAGRLQHSATHTALVLGGLFALAALAWLWMGMSRGAVVTCVFLLGTTLPGTAIHNFTVAAVIAGCVSHDTTPWLESVVAASSAAAGLAMVWAAWKVVRLHRRAE